MKKKIAFGDVLAITITSLVIIVSLIGISIIYEPPQEHVYIGAYKSMEIYGNKIILNLDNTTIFGYYDSRILPINLTQGQMYKITMSGKIITEIVECG